MVTRQIMIASGRQLAVTVAFLYSLSSYATVGSAAIVGRWDGACQASDSNSSSITSYFLTSDQRGYITEFSYNANNCQGQHSASRTPIAYQLSTTANDAFIKFKPVQQKTGSPVEFIYQISALTAQQLSVKIVSYTIEDDHSNLVVSNAPPSMPVVTFINVTRQSTSFGELIEKNAVTLDRAKIVSAIDSVRSLKNYPFLDAGSDIEAQAKSAKNLEPSTTIFYSKLTAFVFNKPNEVSLYSAQNPGNAQCYPHEKRIGMDPDFKSYWKAGDDQVQLTLAHELSHYIYELYLAKLSPKHLSPNGQVSGYGNLPGVDGKGTRSDIIKDSLAYARQHAEVDGFAVTILEQMGFQRSVLKTMVMNRDLPVFKMDDIELSMPLDYLADEELSSQIDIHMRDFVMSHYLQSTQGR